jgi:anti-anti-sigma factor
MSDLLVRTTRRDDRVRIFVIGALDVRSAHDFQQRLGRVLDAAAATPVQVAIDLRCCTYLDTAGLLALATARTTVQSRGGDLHLAAVPPLIECLIDIRGLADPLLRTPKQCGGPEPSGCVNPRSGTFVRASLP